MKTEIKTINNIPTLHINGVPVSGLMSWNRYPSVEDTSVFRNAGLEFYSFMGTIVLPKEGESDDMNTVVDGAPPRMPLTRENIDSTMEMLLGVNPDLKILPRIILNPPQWWLRDNPDEVLRSWNIPKGEYKTIPRASFGAEAWQKYWTKALADTIRYFEEKWGDHIFGYHPGMGDCGEHTHCWWDNVCDFSPRQQKNFRKYLKQKYADIDALNHNWQKQYSSFDDILLPEGRRFSDNSARANTLFLPETEMDLIDFQEFSSHIVADTICQEAKVVKETLRELGKKKICGVFYGYINLVANSTQTTSGHNALTKVLECPDIDFICGPLSYAARQNGGTVMSQMIPGSMVCHGKLFYNEDDTGTHVVQNITHHGYIPATAEESIHAERRNFLETMRTGGSQWWMDLYGKGWFLSEELQNEFARLRQFAEKHYLTRQSNAQIAVFVSLESSFYVRDTPLPITGNLIEHQLAEVCALGASYDIYQLTDLPLLAKKGMLKNYRMCIFLNCTAVEKEMAECIERELKNTQRTLLWFYAPGYIRNSKRDAAFAAELTGIEFSAVESGIMPMLTECWLDGRRLSYGLNRAVYPRLTANDPAAEELGYFVNGTTIVGQKHGSGAALVRRKFADFSSVWSASPGLPSCMLTEFAAEAGVHIYSRRGDQIFTAPGWFGIHAKVSGDLEIPFPGTYRFRDAITGEEFPAGDKLLLKNLRRGETRFFELEKV